MRLIVLEGPAAQPDYEVDQPRILIGRSPDCDVVVFDPQVSRHHAELRLADGRYMIASLQAGNPVIVNDRMVEQPRPLKHGDLLVLGGVLLEVRLPDRPRPAAPLARPTQTPPADQPAPPIQPTELKPRSRGAEQPPRERPRPAGRVEQQSPPPDPPAAAARDDRGGSAPAVGARPRTPVDRSVVRDPGPEQRTPPARDETASQAARPDSSGVQQPRPDEIMAPPRSVAGVARPVAAACEVLRTVANRLRVIGQKLDGAGAAAPVRDVAAVEAGTVALDAIVAEHEVLGGDDELARLSELLSERLGNQTDIRALYRLGAETRALIAWGRVAQHSIVEARRIAAAIDLKITAQPGP